MRNPTRLLLFAACIALVAVQAGPAAAQPEILGANGTVEVGETVTLSGGGFGPGATVISWDDFESGYNEKPILDSSPVIGPDWSLLHNEQNREPYYSNVRSYSGDLAVRVAWCGEEGYPGYGIEAFGWTGQGPYNEMFLSYWRYHDPSNLDILDKNHKQVYTFSRGYANGYSEVQQFMPFMIPAGNSTWGTYLQNQPSVIEYGGPTYEETTWRWDRWDAWIDYEDTPAENDGSFAAWCNFQQYTDQRNINLCNTDVVNGNSVVDLRIGHMFTITDSRYARSYFDDVYVATSRARVELGDSPNFDACTRREIQVAGSWGAGVIDVTMHFSSFQTGEQAYLFVIDENGVVSEGFGVTVGNVETASHPGVPITPVLR